MLLCLFNKTGLTQADLSMSELEEKAFEHFTAESWEEAHRSYAELLSLDGTNSDFQMRYAATLLHDSRLRAEGVQRLAALAESDKLRGEGLYWWGRACLFDGNPERAEAVLKDALEEADKRAFWQADCALALVQSKEMPTRFDVRQGLLKLDAIDVPLSSYYRYVQWSREGVRLMLAPEELRSKKDDKAGIHAPVTWWRGMNQLIFHSYGPKRENGLDLWNVQVNPDGKFDKPVRLPDGVNSPFDEVNPVWDDAVQCLTFASNRPGTIGGMDLWQACLVEGVWTEAQLLGPTYNSVYDDWALYPPDEFSPGWLVTSRSAKFGGTEVWEIELDGPPALPMELNASWDLSQDVIPGSLNLFDASTNKELARVGLNSGRGQWGVVVASGQIIQYTFETKSGKRIEGTYALPTANESSSFNVNLSLSKDDAMTGLSSLNFEPKQAMPSASSNTQWEWGMVLDEVPAIEASEWTEPEETDESIVAESAVDGVKPAKRIVQFQSFAWWTDLQKEERSIAAHILTNYQFLPRRQWSELDAPVDFNAMAAQVEELKTASSLALVQGIVAKASARVIMDDSPWESALNEALDNTQEVWRSAGLRRENLERQANLLWAETGALYDSGEIQDVKDKRSLVGDENWIEAPWASGAMAEHMSQLGALRIVDEQAMRLAQMRSQGPMPEGIEGVMDEKMLSDPSFWSVAGQQSLVRDAEMGLLDADAEEELKKGLVVRLAVLESTIPNDVLDDGLISDAIRAWRTLALPVLKEDVDLKVEELTGAVEEGVNEANEGHESHEQGTATLPDVEGVLQSDWKAQWQNYIEVHSGMATTASSGWRKELIQWLQGQSPDSWLPQSLLLKCSDDLREAHQNQEQPKEHESHWPQSLQQGIDDLLDEISAESRANLSPEDAFSLLEALWLLTLWAEDQEFAVFAPDDILAQLENWPPRVERGLRKMRIDWAKASRNGDLLSLDSTPDKDKMQIVDSEALSDHVDQTENSIEQHQNVDVTDQVDFIKGTRGIHLGWFRQSPQVGNLPAGTQLVHVEGKQGLKRWVLRLSEDWGDESSESLSAWLGKVGVPDAFEVQWDGEIWTRDLTTIQKDSMEGGTTSISGEIPGMEASAKEVDAEVVPIDQLQGEVYAVQIGAFSEDSDQSWLKKFNGPFAFEVLEGGVIRWYGGLHSNMDEARKHLEMIKGHPDFADAFMVKLSEGERAAVGDNDAGDDLVGQSDPGQDSTTESQKADGQEAPNEGEQPGRRGDISTDEAPDAVEVIKTDDSRRREADVSTISSTATAESSRSSESSKISVPRVWHVAIATYDGKVPADEVASFLIRAADWGVRSVELFGQTTYFSKTFNDLKLAEELLAEVQAEGFFDARIQPVE